MPTEKAQAWACADKRTKLELYMALDFFLRQELQLANSLESGELSELPMLIYNASY